MSCVLDASAVLALLQQEPGGDTVASMIGGAVINAVNLCEVGSKLMDLGASRATVSSALSQLPIHVHATEQSIAETAYALRPVSKPLGLSLGDRICLATGIATKLPVLTADQNWLRLPSQTNLSIQCIR